MCVACQLLAAAGLMMMTASPQVMDAMPGAVRRAHPGFIPAAGGRYTVGRLTCLETTIPIARLQATHAGRQLLAGQLLGCWEYLGIETQRSARTWHLAQLAVRQTPPIPAQSSAGQR